MNRRIPEYRVNELPGCLNAGACLMTKDQLDAERKYRLIERLAIMCGESLPTPSQLDAANKEADEAIEKLKGNESIYKF